MSFQKCVTHLSALLVGCALLPVSSIAQLSFQPRQAAQVVSNSNVVAHGDFNNDGREDLVVIVYDTTHQTYVDQLYLSSGDGAYGTPISLPALVQVVGDFNHDGRLDFASVGSSGVVSIYLGNADGTFLAPITFAGPNNETSIFAVDLNHDSKTDLVEVLNTVSQPLTTSLQLWISNGDGTFSKGQTVVASTGSLANQEDSGAVIGDFDGDGKPDMALLFGYVPYNSNTIPVSATVQIWYGDGAGHFGSPYLFADPNKYADSGPVAADINNDGRSDIVAIPGKTTASNSQIPALALFTGNANRTLSYKTITTTSCVGALGTGITVADFNGDGLNDMAYDELPCAPSSSVNTELAVRLGTGSGNFGPEQVVYQNLYQMSQPYTVRTTIGTKPDVVFAQYNGGSSGSITLLSNTSTGAFPGCGLSLIAEGLQICTPGSSATSPVKFSIGAAGPTPMRTAAVWADGKKVAEQLTHAFSNYSFLDASIPLAAGSHAITIYGTGWDNTLQSKSFTLSVGSGGSCPFVGNAVNLCQPLNGSTVSSPVTVLASSNIPGTLARMEVWIDAVKKYTETNSATLSYTISLPPGSHRFAVFAVNTAGGKTETFGYATVK
jgi:hypothetical protein